MFSHLRVVGLLTTFSRILGLVRDMGMAALFGNGPIMDAFSVAFRLPNLARVLFGEGALTTAFLPVFIRELQQSGREAAGRVATAVFATVAVVLSGLVLVIELGIWLGATLFEFSPETELLLGLSAVLMPYVILICLAAQVSAVLNALGHFAWPAVVPVVLNVVWLAAIWLLAPRVSSPVTQVYLVSGCIVVAGGLQLLTPLPMLFRLGFRLDPAWRAARGQVAAIIRTMLPVLLGLSITQLNTISDSLIAWGLSQPGIEAMFAEGSPFRLRDGTASALYFGQRLYQFPLGVFGVALGTVLFPLLTAHAQRGEMDRLRDDLTLGLRLVAVIGLPASAGLMLLARPLASLCFEYGEFDADDARQTAEMIAAYGVGVWAYCGLLIVHRGFYAIGDRRTPVRIGMVAVALNLVLNLLLLWPFGASGLALATALTAMVQILIAVWAYEQRVGRLDWPALWRTGLKTLLCTAAMSVACWLTLRLLADVPLSRSLRVALPFGAALVAFSAAAWLLRLNELWLLLRRGQSIQAGAEE